MLYIPALSKVRMTIVLTPLNKAGVSYIYLMALQQFNKVLRAKCNLHGGTYNYGLRNVISLVISCVPAFANTCRKALA